MVDLPEADPNLVFRRYHFPIAHQSLDAGRHATTIHLLTTEGKPTIAAPITVIIEILDAVTVIPASIVFMPGSDTKMRPRRITVLCRGKGSLNVNPVFDRDIVEVNAVLPTADSVATFEISPVADSSRHADTKVLFELGEFGARVLEVGFKP